MAYQKQTWVDYPDRSTPITAERLNHMEAGIEEGNVVRYSNPNLLDNPFFTVNQREGKITPYGIPLYADASLSNVIAISNSALPVVELTATYAKVRDITVSVESYLYTKASDVVDGYVNGNGLSYSFDRWLLYGNVKKNEDVLSVFVPTDYPYAFISQRIERSLAANLIGKEIIYSLLESDGTVRSGTHIFGENFVVQSTWGYGDIFYDGTAWCARIVVNSGKEAHIKAVKLELGSISTLANDVAPNYAEELAKCQRYYQFYRGYIALNQARRTSFPLITTMRVSPAVLSLVSEVEGVNAYITESVVHLYSDNTSGAFGGVSELILSADL